jgi:hypothetical protein
LSLTSFCHENFGDDTLLNTFVTGYWVATAMTRKVRRFGVLAKLVRPFH